MTMKEENMMLPKNEAHTSFEQKSDVMFYMVGNQQKSNKANTHKTKTMTEQVQIETMDINRAHRAFRTYKQRFIAQNCKSRKYPTNRRADNMYRLRAGKGKSKIRAQSDSCQCHYAEQEQLYLVTSGCYHKLIIGNWYWFKMVDDYSRKSWSFFMKFKTQVLTKVKEHLVHLKGI